MGNLDDVKRDFKIESFKKLTNEQMTDLLRAHNQGKISVAQLEQIAAMAPHFAAISKEVASALARTAEAAGRSQESALTEVGKTRDAIIALASHPSTDKDIIKLIIEKLSELASQLERMNQSNNSLFDKIKTGLAITGVVLLAAISAGAALESRGKA